VAPDNPRIAELRRRVHADPASIAFAQLAEEYRRAGLYQEAVTYCRTGLARHPGYLSARVTLGRSLLELGELDAAAREFCLVLDSAPDNLAAIRSMAQVHRRRGALPAALEYYTRALALARFDSELEDTVNRIGAEIGIADSLRPTEGLSCAEATSQFLALAAGTPAAEPTAARSPAREPTSALPTIEPLIDFDALLASLGVPDASPPPVMEMLLSDPVAAPFLESVVPQGPDQAPDDPFVALEQELRAFHDARPLVQPAPEESRQTADAGADGADHRVVDELEAWLDVLSVRPASPPNA
jgi:tetratricopeptide (TPR) repeat protein